MQKIIVTIAVVSGCATVRPWQREQLAAPVMQAEVNPYAETQERSLREITEGGTFGGGPAGEAAAGCGCH
jgi:hypothetical protein